MSTQFDTSNASAVRVIDNNAAAGATNWAATAPHHDHHQKQLVTHIAVHTPIHAPRGSSCESQSFPAYSNGSPQAGFHMPANAFSTVTSSSCATSTPYQRQICFEKGAATTATIVEKSEPATDADNENDGSIISEFDDPKVKIETTDSAQMSNDEVGDQSFHDTSNATSQSGNGVTPISTTKINTTECFPFYKQQLTRGSGRETQQQFNNDTDECHNSNNDAERRAKALAGGIAAPQPLRGDAPIYNNNLPATIESSGSEQVAELSSEQNCDSKINNNNNNNSVVNNNSAGQRNNNVENNNNSLANNNNSAGQFYSLGKSGNRTFFRAPGLEAPDMSQMSAVDSSIRVCPVCSFSCKSTFHYNSHMNTHSDHQCTMCNYTSRTEGRLRKHMNESHTHAERIRAGLENATTNGMSTSPDVTNTSGALVIDASPSISTTMTSIVNMVNMAAAATTTVASVGNAAQDLLAISERNGQSAVGFAPSYSDALSSLNLIKDASPNKGALDQIKALTERASNPLSALNEFLGIPTTHNGSGLQNDHDKDVGGLRDLMDEDDEMDADVPTSSSGTQSHLQQRLTQPVVRRSGRPKMYRCKQCQYVSTTKDERWAHSKTHIPLDKQLVCTHCGFVTEYKHHLEYHMRNHKGSKPFKCSKCAYTCVNKSMLNSHMKSHTPVYQYRCKDCTYQTKYCHSLKMHLEKYRHTRMPGTVEMDSDGEEKPISEGDPDDYGNMDVSESRNGGEDSHQGDFSVVSADEHQDEQQQQNQLSQQSQQQQQQQQNTAHSTLNSMLLQPIASSASLAQYSDQIQQYPSLRQLEQVNELLRAANSTTFSCRQCDYVTTSNDELLRHSVAHLFANQQQQSTSSLTSLYQNLAAAQQQTSGSDVFVGQQQQNLNTVLGSTGSELLNGILQPDSSTKELAAQLQQELLRAQVVAQQQQQQQQEEESRRQAVVAAMASLANGNLGNGAGATISNNALTSALLGHVSSSATSTSASIEPETHSIAFPTQYHQPQQDQHSARIFTPTSHMTSIADNSSTVVEPTSTHFHSSTTTTSSFGFGNDDDELQLAHSLSPTGSSGRRGSVGSASTSGGESTSKTCSVSPGSEGHGGSRKQRKPSKTIKVDQISVKLRDNADPSKNHRFREQDNEEHRSKSNGTVSKSSSSDYGGLQPRSNTNGSGSSEESNFSTLLAQLNQQNQMPHSCQHCMIAFRDRALYQIHLGYHGYDTPFKCNRCGHISDSSLEFNLHLYQAKHD